MISKDKEKCNFAVIGLGRIGLPIAVNAASKGFRVLGVEMNEHTVQILSEKKTPFQESGLDTKLKETVGINFFPKVSKLLSEEDFSSIECVMVAVGVHNINQRYPEPFEYDSIERVIQYLVEMKCLENKLLILRPTQPIGSTRKVKEIIRKSTGFNEGKDYFLAYMPERILEGSALEEEESLPKIIGTFNEKSFKVANNLVSKLGGQIKKVSSPEVAEFVKLLDNSWRHTRFAFANDAALAAENVGIDVTEAINAANFEYPRNSIAKPGPVSGYCLGKDPYIFEYSFRKTELLRNFNSLWYQSIQSSKYLLDHIISQVSGKNVLLMGLSFKKDIDDYRLSHGVFLLKKLVEEGFLVTVIDKNFESNDYTKLDSSLKEVIEIKKDINELENSSCFNTVIISIDNKEYSNIQSFLLKHDKIVDLWGMFKNERQRFKNYWALGRGNI